MEPAAQGIRNRRRAVFLPSKWVRTFRLEIEINVHFIGKEGQGLWIARSDFIDNLGFGFISKASVFYRKRGLKDIYIPQIMLRPVMIMNKPVKRIKRLKYLSPIR